MAMPLRVLLIDDSEDDVLLLLRGLKRGGFDTTWERVETSKQMIHALDNNAWDIILSDFNMPHFTSSAALSLIKEKGTSAPLIVVSGIISPADEEKVLREGALAYITKDQIDKLVALIKSTC